MAQYARLNDWLTNPKIIAWKNLLEAWVAPYLVDLWLAEYLQRIYGRRIVSVPADGHDYLFDIPRQRLIAAWSISRGAYAGPRDKSRMQGHPQGRGPLYHKGHAIPHSCHGGYDINLVTQLAALNIGPFRALERRAAASSGALYFTYWRYPNADEQVPSGVEQGYLEPGLMPDIRRFNN